MLHCITYDNVTLHSITWLSHIHDMVLHHYMVLHYVTARFTLRYIQCHIALGPITLHYIVLHHSNVLHCACDILSLYHVM